MFEYETPEHDTEIVEGLGPWTRRSRWCEKHCRGRWEYPGLGRFIFWNERDYFWFLLRWS